MRQNTFEKKVMYARQLHRGECKSLLRQKKIDLVCRSVCLKGSVGLSFLSNRFLTIILLKPLADLLT